MGKLKNKIINLFFEDSEDETEVVESAKVIKRRKILAASIVLNFILNILFVSFVCYGRETNNICYVIFVFSVTWTVVSLVSSYRLYGKGSSLLFYINLIILLFISKLWFIYL
jgi:hypothetical protein